jgi:hypothetical protein
MPDPVPELAPVLPRSVFVSVLGWIGIIFCGFGLLVGVLQILMVRTMFRDPQIGAILADSVKHAPFPPEGRFMFGQLQSLVSIVLLSTLLGFAASIGLLKRLNLARLTVIALLALYIAWTLYSLILQQHWFNWMSKPPFPSTAPPPGFAAIFRVMRIFMVGMSLGTTALCAWLITRLTSRSIRAEFVSGVA